MPIDCDFFSVDEISLENIIKTVVREHHWQPSIIRRLFLDKHDHDGLFFWFNDIIDGMPEGDEKNKMLKHKV